MNKKIGFIGLGIMGSRMARNLQKAGCDLIIYNRTKEKGIELIENGALWASSPKEVAAQSDILITMLSTPEVVQNTIATILSSFKSGALWINTSTINPSFTEEMGTLSRKHNIRYLDAPVAGTKGPAEAGELLFLTGGDSQDLEEAKSLLDCMGKKTIHLGTIGKGAAMKMLINQLLGQQMAAVAEALTMGKAMGLEEDLLLNVLTATPVVAPIIQVVRPKLEQQNYEANFPLKWLHKDLHLSSISAYEAGVATPSLNATKELYAKATQDGLGDLDFTAIYKYLESK